jgi:hypothetical protein
VDACNNTSVTRTQTITVTCPCYPAPLTPGYWKNHLAPSNDPDCRKLKYGSCSSNGPWAKPCLIGPPVLVLGNYSVGTISLAGQVFDGMNCSSSKPQDAIGCLAGHLLAAKLNRCSLGTDPCIDNVIALANQFLTNPPATQVTFGGYTATSINYTGPTATYNLTGPQRSLAVALKTALDRYNNGLGCP